MSNNCAPEFEWVGPNPAATALGGRLKRSLPCPCPLPACLPPPFWALPPLHRRRADDGRPVLNAAPGCESGVSDAYAAGYLDGVEAVKAQLAQSTAAVQAQVQDQLNAQLAQMQAQSAAELDTRIAAAQDQALADQAGAAPGARMPSLSADASGAGLAHRRRRGATAKRAAKAAGRYG